MPAISPWILGPWKDLLLFIGTPLLIVPLALFFRTGFASRDIQYFVLAFGALGHNLPGMLRAYGDRELFQRFRTRFLLAPIAFLILTVGLSYRGGDGLTLILFLWSVWHALMQQYGFMRIYDAKVGNLSALDTRLDFHLCTVGFLSAVLWADHRLDYIQSALAGFGIPPLAPTLLGPLRWGALAIFAGLCCAYAWNQWQLLRAARPVNPAKTLSMIGSLGFWWFANVYFQDILVGVVLFEVFHDVQYLAIVWIFHRRRVDSGAPVGRFTRFLFRRSYGLMALYVSMCLAYGSFLPLTQTQVRSETGLLWATAIVSVSGLLHFYYDGFIWKVREGSTRKGLGLDDKVGRSDINRTYHGWKWLLLAIPALIFFVSDDQTVDLPMAEALAASTPHSAVAQERLGDCFARERRFAEAFAAYQLAQQLSGASDRLDRNFKLVAADAGLEHINAGREALRLDQLDTARTELTAAAMYLPDLVIGMHDRGYARWQAGEVAEAILDYRAALVVAPDLAIAHLNLALAYRDSGQRALALQHAKRGAALLPGNEKAQRLIMELGG